MEVHTAQFDWAEYTVFGLMLAMSSLIGIYFGCIKGGQDTVDGYLLGGKQMTVFPIAMSLISSYISGITLLGVPTEVYTYGTQYLMCNFANYAVGIITAVVMLPVFYKLQLLSLYEYLEMRFSHKVRLITSFLYTVSLLAYIPIVIYGPALALNQVSGLNVHLVTPIICTVCIFYTTLGGLKAVVWSDALQGAVMMGSVLAVIFLGASKVGGFKSVFDASLEGGRLEFFNMDPDPTVRLSFWSSTVGLTFFWLANFSVSPASVQRFISLPTFKEAQISVVYLSLGVSAFISFSGFIGLIMYAGYKGCDPLTAKIIDRPDQILPHFVLLVAQNVRGLPGLFLAGIVCAALSSMSTCLNTLAGTFYEDFLEPLFPVKLSEKRASLIMKILVVVFGTICVFLVAIIEKLGAILEMSAGFGGVTAGTTLGIFLLGLLFPWATTKGALIGGIVSLVSMVWLLVGTTLARTQGLIKHPTKVLSIDTCQMNVTLAQTPMTEEVPHLFPLYRLSIFYYSMLGCFIVLFVGLVVSFMTGANDLSTVNPDLLSPLVHRFLPKKTHYNVVKMKDSALKDKNCT